VNDTHAHPVTLASILNRYGARLSPDRGEPVPAAKRLPVSKYLADHFQAFNSLRLHLLNPKAHPSLEKSPASVLECARFLASQGFVRLVDPGKVVYRVNPEHTYALLYLNGEWLEELVFEAFSRSGSEETTYRQKVLWGSPDCPSHFEVDVMARRGELVVFSSCKAIKPDPESGKSTELRRFMSEALSWDQLFSGGKARVLVVTTAEMVDQRKKTTLYAPLEEQARVLGEVLLGIEDLSWDKLCRMVGKILEGKDPEGEGGVHFLKSPQPPLAGGSGRSDREGGPS